MRNYVHANHLAYVARVSVGARSFLLRLAWFSKEWEEGRGGWFRREQKARGTSALQQKCLLYRLRTTEREVFTSFYLLREREVEEVKVRWTLPVKPKKSKLHSAIWYCAAGFWCLYYIRDDRNPLTEPWACWTDSD